MSESGVGVKSEVDGRFQGNRSGDRHKPLACGRSKEHEAPPHDRPASDNRNPCQGIENHRLTKRRELAKMSLEKASRNTRQSPSTLVEPTGRCTRSGEVIAAPSRHGRAGCPQRRTIFGFLMEERSLVVYTRSLGAGVRAAHAKDTSRYPSEEEPDGLRSGSPSREPAEPCPECRGNVERSKL